MSEGAARGHLGMHHGRNWWSMTALHSVHSVTEVLTLQGAKSWPPTCPQANMKAVVLLPGVGGAEGCQWLGASSAEGARVSQQAHDVAAKHVAGQVVEAEAVALGRSAHRGEADAPASCAAIIEEFVQVYASQDSQLAPQSQMQQSDRQLAAQHDYQLSGKPFQQQEGQLRPQTCMRRAFNSAEFCMHGCPRKLGQRCQISCHRV